MAVITTSLPRNFYINGRRVPDPNPDFSVDEVQNFLSGTNPELNNASYTSQATASEVKVTFTTSVGHKG